MVRPGLPAACPRAPHCLDAPPFPSLFEQLLYVSTIVVSFLVLVTHLSPHLTLCELAVASVPVGTIAGAWLLFLMSMLLSFLGYGTGSQALVSTLPCSVRCDPHLLACSPRPAWLPGWEVRHCGVFLIACFFPCGVQKWPALATSCCATGLCCAPRPHCLS